ncbi:helix-hairpin-helix domain-containing protein [Agromyces sp. SYSU T0242]|uniref:helix-hairpin-helix domain-containing protein n=1 Tax=Agromyces litoreus TaxID=3158561 RepID=UPI003399514F
MTDATTDDPLAPLSGSRARPRSRIAVGAAVALFVLAVAISALTSFAASGGGTQGDLVRDGDPGTSAAEPGTPDAASVGDAGTGGEPTILVHVLGAVEAPGIVELATGARVVDAIAAAGGVTADADPGGVNLARTVADGEQLVVPRVGEVPPATAASGATGGGASGGLVSLNRADAAEFDTLPRIGPALAQRIIDWREANGPFTDVAQLLEVAGIGDAIYAGLVDLVSL